MPAPDNHWNSSTPDGLVRVGTQGSRADVQKTRAAASQSAITIGRTIRKLRGSRGLSLQELGQGAGVSASFIGALERGETDIAIGRLDRIAEFLREDLGSILGYSRQDVRFNYVPREDRVVLDRGRGISYALCQIPLTAQQLIDLVLDPGSRLDEPIAHDGMVTVTVTEGEMQVVVADRIFNVREGDCGSFAAKNPHTLLNETQSVARAILVASNEH